MGVAEVEWKHLSSSRGELPVPAGSHQQTGLLVVDVDRDGAQDFVISFRVKAPALVLFRYTKAGWKQYIVEPEFLTLEAGGAAYDIDGDGDLDLVFGHDAQGSQMWWWENPWPRLEAATPWRRYVIKAGGARQHHDQIFADLKGSGRPQLVFWNQKAKSIFLAEIPKHPKLTQPWPAKVIFSEEGGRGYADAARYPEGLDAFDIDQDGKLDLLAGNCWFKLDKKGRFRPIRVGEFGGRIRAGRFLATKAPQIVIAPGDGNGPLMFYRCDGNPLEASCWQGRNLLPQDMVHGHTLDLGDIDGDGNLDIFAAEMAKWTSQPGVDHPEAKSWILYGDGRGQFRTTVLTVGHGWHEGRLADVDGDGDLDIIGKPYTWNAPRVDVWLNQGAPKR
ncbi:MAG: VCBS repeat-containing protein [Bryobacteraceae bacterium]|nr:VCBS repeat-containing protein [Bryobacteraceae bacterium]MDW8377109.1 VCBS repeat-containing protein [Bryobacterales bacterium]